MKHLLKFWLVVISLGIIGYSCVSENETTIDLSGASILISPELKAPLNQTALSVLTEEVEKRTGLKLKNDNNWHNKTIIAMALASDTSLFGESISTDKEHPQSTKEGFRLSYEKKGDQHIIWIIGNDGRSILYGIGKLLRMADFRNGMFAISKSIDLATAPEYPIRGHQFGYRMTANSWDAWTIEQFDQHFREQALFGANAIEGIPFQDERIDTLMKYPREVMNVAFSKICQKYDLDYWIWAAVEVDLKDPVQRQGELDQYEAFFKACPRFDAVFFPGGDPGDNHPSEVLPFLEDMTTIMHQYHPNATMWISLQGFNSEKIDYFFNYLEEHNPDWLSGVVNGPSSPPIQIERERLPKKYKLRSYPDLTHTVRCQFPVKNWDQAFALTEGRECTNPQPIYYAEIHNNDAPYTDGFISYSDGVHDDVNKVVWSQMAWDSKSDVRNILVEYCNFFFGSAVAREAAHGILALEQNWVGPIAGNALIGKTLGLWQKLEAENPQLAGNWRWQQMVMRAYYDAYIQQRLAYEKKLEAEAYAILADAKILGAGQAVDLALAHLQLAQKEPAARDLRAKTIQYIDDLYLSVGLQTSVELHNAAGYERGCIRDFIDYPLNNLWWLEDEFNKIKKLNGEEDKLERLDFIRTYEDPGEGSFYDNISSADAKHVTSETEDAIDYLWENNGFSRKRLSTQLFQFSPVLEYDELDPNTDYLIRVSGYGEALLRANGERLKPTKYEKGFEQFKEFPLSKDLLKTGKLKITFDQPDEEHLNWRQQSRVTDVWILKHPK